MTIATRVMPPQPLPREKLTGLSGKQTLEMIMNGDLPAPPFAATMLIDLAEVDEGRVVFTGQCDFSFLNPMGTVHGGWIAAILDSAMGAPCIRPCTPGRFTRLRR